MVPTLSAQSTRVAVIIQPSYLPWLGYFAQIHRSDVFVLYDDVQFDKHSWRNRNRIKTAQGPHWLTVPVLTKGKNWPTNREIEIDNRQDWRHKHLETLRQSYRRAPYFDEVIGVFESLYRAEYRFLLELNVASLRAMNELLGLRPMTRFSSEFNLSGGPVERLVQICKAVNATSFYEGASGRNYIEDTEFAQAGISIEYQDYKHPVYPQLHGEFIPFLSVVDLIFNCGPRSLEVLAQ